MKQVGYKIRNTCRFWPSSIFSVLFRHHPYYIMFASKRFDNSQNTISSSHIAQQQSRKRCIVDSDSESDSESQLSEERGIRLPRILPDHPRKKGSFQIDDCVAACAVCDLCKGDLSGEDLDNAQTLVNELSNYAHPEVRKLAPFGYSCDRFMKMMPAYKPGHKGVIKLATNKVVYQIDGVGDKCVITWQSAYWKGNGSRLLKRSSHTAPPKDATPVQEVTAAPLVETPMTTPEPVRPVAKPVEPAPVVEVPPTLATTPSVAQVIPKPAVRAKRMVRPSIDLKRYSMPMRDYTDREIEEEDVMLAWVVITLKTVPPEVCPEATVISTIRLLYPHLHSSLVDEVVARKTVAGLIPRFKTIGRTGKWDVYAGEEKIECCVKQLKNGSRVLSSWNLPDWKYTYPGVPVWKWAPKDIPVNIDDSSDEHEEEAPSSQSIPAPKPVELVPVSSGQASVDSDDAGKTKFKPVINIKGSVVFGTRSIGKPDLQDVVIAWVIVTLRAVPSEVCPKDSVMIIIQRLFPLIHRELAEKVVQCRTYTWLEKYLPAVLPTGARTLNAGGLEIEYWLNDKKSGHPRFFAWNMNGWHWDHQDISPRILEGDDRTHDNKLMHHAAVAWALLCIQQSSSKSKQCVIDLKNNLKYHHHWYFALVTWALYDAHGLQPPPEFYTVHPRNDGVYEYDLFGRPFIYKVQLDEDSYKTFIVYWAYDNISWDIVNGIVIENPPALQEVESTRAESPSRLVEDWDDSDERMPGLLSSPRASLPSMGAFSSSGPEIMSTMDSLTTDEIDLTRFARSWILSHLMFHTNCRPDVGKVVTQHAWALDFVSEQERLGIDYVEPVDVLDAMMLAIVARRDIDVEGSTGNLETGVTFQMRATGTYIKQLRRFMPTVSWSLHKNNVMVISGSVENGKETLCVKQSHPCNV